MALTGEQLLQGFSESIGDWWSSTATSTAANSGSLTDTALEAFDDDKFDGAWLRVTQADTNQYLVRRIQTGPLAGALTWDPDVAEAIASGDTYQLHRFDPREKFKALDLARMLAYPQVSILRLDETITGDGVNKEILIPSTIRKGPVEVWEEEPLDPSAGWNGLSDTTFNTLSSKWTAAGATASLYARSDFDLLAPLFEQNCVKLVGSGTYTQAVANMRLGLTAAGLAGRRVTFAMKVYQRGTTGTATITIDHSGTDATSSVHQGKGWEVLSVTATIPSGNSVFNVYLTTGGSVTVLVERAWLIGADRLPLTYPTLLTKRGTVRDDTTQFVRLNRVPRRGYQLRFIGRDPLSALGQVASTQGTLSMEVDQFSAQLLYAKAARVLLTRRGWTTGKIEEAYPFIAETEARFAEMADFGYDLPHEMKLAGWWQL